MLKYLVLHTFISCLINSFITPCSYKKNMCLYHCKLRAWLYLPCFMLDFFSINIIVVSCTAHLHCTTRCQQFFAWNNSSKLNKPYIFEHAFLSNSHWKLTKYLQRLMCSNCISGLSTVLLCYFFILNQSYDLKSSLVLIMLSGGVHSVIYVSKKKFQVLE